MSRIRGFLSQILFVLFIGLLMGVGLLGFMHFSDRPAEGEKEPLKTVPSEVDERPGLQEGLVASDSSERVTSDRDPLLSADEQRDRYDPRIEFDPQREPNWKLRRDFYREHGLDTFTPPRSGQEITVGLQGGRSLSGTLMSTNQTGVVLDVGNGEVEIAMDQLSLEGRALFYEPDAVEWNATRLTLHERQRWRAKRKELEDQKNRASQRASQIPPGKPRNRPPDGSVLQVEAYLARKLPDPKSVKFLEWSQVMPAPEGYRVRCKYRAKTTSGGYATRTQVFVMNEAGKVVKVLNPHS